MYPVNDLPCNLGSDYHGLNKQDTALAQYALFFSYRWDTVVIQIRRHADLVAKWWWSAFGRVAACSQIEQGTSCLFLHFFKYVNFSGFNLLVATFILFYLFMYLFTKYFLTYMRSYLLDICLLIHLFRFFCIHSLLLFSH
jgi:hypothetical protein